MIEKLKEGRLSYTKKQLISPLKWKGQNNQYMRHSTFLFYVS